VKVNEVSKLYILI